MLVSGRSADNKLVEIVELKEHPWFVATQFHPEFKSRPTRPHPLFRDFVGAALRRSHTHGTAGTGADETSTTTITGLPEGEPAARNGHYAPAAEEQPAGTR